MNDINKPIGENIGGLAEFYFSPITNIIEIADPINGVINSVTFNEGKGWFRIFYAHGTALFFEKKKTEAYGNIYEAGIELFIPNNSSETLADIKSMLNYRYVVYFKDNNGNYRIAGDRETPLRFSYKYTTGKKSSDKKGFIMQFFLIKNFRAYNFAVNEAPLNSITFALNNVEYFTSYFEATEEIIFIVDWGNGETEEFSFAAGSIEKNFLELGDRIIIIYTSANIIDKIICTISHISSIIIDKIKIINLLINDNELISLDISENDKLEWLDASNNNLEVISLSNLSENLKEINLYQNSLLQQSINHILLICDLSGANDGVLNLAGGTNVIPTGGMSNANYLSLLSKGWMIEINWM